MTWIQYEGLASAVLGAAGTIILFLSTYSIEPLEGGVFGSPEVYEGNNRVRAKNAKRLIWQRIGLGFLCGSFFVQIVMAVR